MARATRERAAPLIAFAGGGTGGHVFPGIAVAENLAARRSVRLLWIGASGDIEEEIVERAGIPFRGIPAGKLRRYLSVRNVVDVFRVVAGILSSLLILAGKRPALLFSKGGYASVPPVIAARLLRIPVVTHESDADPGLATRINARFAARILVPYAVTAQRFPAAQRARVVVTGNPLRRSILDGDAATGMRIAGFSQSDERPVLLFLGGSLGARQLNELVIAIHGRIAESWRIIHQTGERSGDLDFPASGADYFRSAFFSVELPHLIACADAVVCRAGAGTLWEVAALAKPMLLVPLRAGSRGDQERNAEVFERAGGATVLRSNETLANDAVHELERMRHDPDARVNMGRNAHALIHIDASDQIVTILEEMLDNR